MGLLAPVIGFLVDRFGSRKLIFCGTIAAGFGLILLSMTRSLAMFYGAFLVLCFGAGGCLSIVLISAVANWFSKNLGKAMGVAACGMGSGGLMIPLIVRLIEIYQWRTTLFIFGVGMWVLGIPLSLLMRDHLVIPLKSATGSDSNRPPVPTKIGHRFRSKSATLSERSDAGF